MQPWLADLSTRGRALVLASLVLLVGTVGVAVSAAGGDDDPVRTAGSSTTLRSSTSSSSTSTTTSTSTPTTAAAAPATDSTAAATATTAKARVTATTKAPATTQAPTTTRAPATTQAPSGTCNGTSTNAAANELAASYCSYRNSQGLAQMKRTSALDRMAQEWAQHMAANQTMVHRPFDTSPSGVQYGVTHACTSCVRWAENIAYNATAAQAWQSWLVSPAHLDNIRRNIPGEFGMGAAVGANGLLYVVQEFGHYA